MVTHRCWILPCAALGVNLVGGCTPERAAAEPEFSAELPSSPLRADDPAPLIRGLRVPSGVLSAPLSELPPPLGRAALASEDTVLDETMDPVLDADLDTEPNEAMDDAFAEAKAAGRNTRTYGLAALTASQLFGDAFQPGACETPVATESVEFEGERWDIEMTLPKMSMFIGDFTPQVTPLPELCNEAIGAAGGNLAAAEASHDCLDLDIEQFFPEGSVCRACVEGNGGGFDACVESEECPVEAPYVVASTSGTGETLYWEVAQAYVLACAPDYSTSTLLLTQIAVDGSFPDAFDANDWGYICYPYWDEGINNVNYLCTGEGDTVGQGLWGGIRDMHSKSDPTPRHTHRAFYTPRMELSNGWTVDWNWNSYDITGKLSYPIEYPDTNADGVVDSLDVYTGFGGPFGWGLNPLGLRPDGSDPDRLDDTFARDWIAAYAIKTATTRSGIIINPYNHSHCAADAWEEAQDDGTFRCTNVENPEAGFLNDAYNTYWALGVQTLAMPSATVGSTGLPDPEIPGGIVPLIAGSPTLASPDFDECTLPHTFLPDHIAYPDVPGDWSGPASLWGDTYRFGAHPELDLRMVINTNTARNWCDGGEPE